MTRKIGWGICVFKFSKVLVYPPIHDRDNNLTDSHTLAIMRGNTKHPYVHPKNAYLLFR